MYRRMTWWLMCNEIKAILTKLSFLVKCFPGVTKVDNKKKPSFLVMMILMFDSGSISSN